MTPVTMPGQSAASNARRAQCTATSAPSESDETPATARGPAVSGRPGGARRCAAPVREVARPADHQPARPHRSAVVRRQRAVRRTRPSCCSRPTTMCSACSTARASTLEELGVARATAGRRAPIRARLAAVRRALSPVPRHAVAHVARLGVRRSVRHRRCALDADTADHYFDRIGEALATAGVPAARAVRAVQHRGARDHRSRRSTTLDASRARSARAAGRAASITAYRPDPVVDPEHERFRRQRSSGSAS